MSAFLKKTTKRVCRNITKGLSNGKLRLFKQAKYGIGMKSLTKSFGTRARIGKGLYKPAKSLLNLQKKKFATTPMPYRVGYGLGSIIEPEVIKGMEEEAKVRSEIVVLEQTENDMESTAKSIRQERDRLAQEAKITGDPFDPKPYNDQYKAMMDRRTPIRSQKLEAYNKLFETMQNLQARGQVATFNSGMQSPVVWEDSEITYLDRAYDTITVDASLHVFEGTKQSMQDFAAGVASSTAAKVASVNENTKKQISAAVSSSFQAQSNRTTEEHTAEGVLVLTSFATHRKVQQFKNMKLDAIKLVKAYNHYYDDKINRLQINESEFFVNDPAKRIAILTECFLGSAMVGLVHLTRRQSTSSSQRSFSSESQASAAVKFSTFLSSVTGSSQVSTNVASRVANMMSTDQIDVKFDLSCFGYLPKLHSSELQMAVKEFKDFDPSTFGKQSAKIIGANLQDVDASAGLKDSKETTVRQSNMGSVIENTIMGIKKAESLVQTNVLDMQSFMEAFDDYTANAPTTDGVGIPVGMNVQSYGRGDITFEYAKQFLGVNEDRTQESFAEQQVSGNTGSTTTE